MGFRIRILVSRIRDSGIGILELWIRILDSWIQGFWETNFFGFGLGFGVGLETNFLGFGIRILGFWKLTIWRIQDSGFGIRKLTFWGFGILDSGFGN